MSCCVSFNNCVWWLLWCSSVSCIWLVVMLRFVYRCGVLRLKKRGKFVICCFYVEGNFGFFGLCG